VTLSSEEAILMKFSMKRKAVLCGVTILLTMQMFIRNALDIVCDWLAEIPSYDREITVYGCADDLSQIQIYSDDW
jgi:hypothetical protein